MEVSPTEVGGWIWCAACARCYHILAARQMGAWRFCAYKDCDAEIIMHALPWSRVRVCDSTYPEIPELEVRYVGPKNYPPPLLRQESKAELAEK